MRIAFLAATTLLVSACSPDVEERKIQWQALLVTEVPLGSSKDRVIQWSEKHGVKFGYPENTHTLFAKAEKIPTPDSLVCSEWDITIQIGFNADNISTSQKVEAIGICL